MGCKQSVSPAVSTDSEAAASTGQVPKGYKRHLKLVLLGAGETGKSTLIKQLRLMHNQPLSPVETEMCARALRGSSIECMQALIQAAERFGVQLSQDAVAMAESVAAVDSENPDHYTPELASMIETLWEDDVVQSVFARRTEYWILDAAPYLFENARRFAQAGYMPNVDDLMFSRSKTTGQHTTQFGDGDTFYSVVDIGGQQSERRKWLNACSGAHAVIFVVSLAEFSQVLYEDGNVNRMHESLRLFDEICRFPSLKSTPIFLFLNKKDLMNQTLKVTKLESVFPEYHGDTALTAIDFITHEFEKVYKAAHSNTANYRSFVVSARLRMDIKIAFGEIKTSLKQRNRSRSRSASS